MIRKLASIAIAAAAIATTTMIAAQSAAMASSTPAKTASASAPAAFAAAPAKAAPASTPLTYVVVPRNGSAPPEATTASCNSTNWNVALLGYYYYIYICGGPGTITGIKQFGPYFALATVVSNRIWLHQNADNSGWADCFESRADASWTISNTRDSSPGNLQVSANTAPC